jgi:hypothetical protein
MEHVRGLLFDELHDLLELNRERCVLRDELEHLPLSPFKGVLTQELGGARHEGDAVIPDCLDPARLGDALGVEAGAVRTLNRDLSGSSEDGAPNDEHAVGSLHAGSITDERGRGEPAPPETGGDSSVQSSTKP